MTTATTVLNIARSQLGYREGPNNDTKYGTWYGWNFAPYCAMGISWSFAQAGALGLVYGKHAYCPWWVRDFEAHGRFHSWQTTPQRGDLGFADWSGRHGLAEHVFLVEDVISISVIQTLEFNTTSGTPGNQSDGGGVYRRRRNTLYVAGYGRPAYAPEGHVAPLPASRDHIRTLPLLVDGCWGRNTTIRLQQWLHVTADGAYGPATKRALQRAVGVPADGAIGPQTVRALQRKVGAPADGVLGRGTVRALQRYLNRSV